VSFGGAEGAPAAAGAKGELEVAVLVELLLPKTLPDAGAAEPKRLGLPAPARLPKGEVDEAASLAKPEVAKAEEEVCLGCCCCCCCC
jgi:hypothetical protein